MLDQLLPLSSSRKRSSPSERLSSLDKPSQPQICLVICQLSQLPRTDEGQTSSSIMSSFDPYPSELVVHREGFRSPLLLFDHFSKLCQMSSHALDFKEGR